MFKAPRLVRGFGILFAAALAMTACSPPASDPGATTPQTANNDSTPATTQSVDATTSPETTAATGGGTLRYHLYQAPTGFSPFHALHGADGEIAGLHFRPLVQDQGDVVAPMLASEWEVSDDATTYTFTLRETNWSDGTPFTSADVLWSYHAYANPEVASNFGGQLATVAGFEEFASGSATEISGLAAPDDRTFVITLAEGNSAFPPDIVGLAVVPKHIYESIEYAALQGAPEFREPPVGIGPYIFSRWVTDDQIEFVPNDESFEDHPLDTLYAQFLESNVARAQLETGEIDIAQLASSDVESVKEGGTINVSIAEGARLMSLYTALDSGKLADPRVRQAITHAIDRQAIVENVIGGMGTVIDTNLFTPEWAVASDLASYDYDPEKAKALLAEAGWNADTEVNLDIVPGQADRDAIMDIVVGQLSAVGIDAKLRALQPAELTTLIEERQFDLLITTLALNKAEPASINPRFMCEGGGNISAYCNPDLDAALQAGVATTDQAEREELYQEASRILNQDLPAIPLYVVDQPWGSTERVQGFDPNKGNLWTAQFWSVTD